MKSDADRLLIDVIVGGTDLRCWMDGADGEPWDACEGRLRADERVGEVERAARRY